MSNLQQHLHELKVRCFYVVLSFILTFFLWFSNQRESLYLLSKPFLEFQKTFVFFDLTEAFYVTLKTSFLFSFLIIFFFIVSFLVFFYS